MYVCIPSTCVSSADFNFNKFIKLHLLYRLKVLSSPIQRGAEGEEIRRYLAYITTDKVVLVSGPHPPLRLPNVLIDGYLVNNNNNIFVYVGGSDVATS